MNQITTRTWLLISIAVLMGCSSLGEKTEPIASVPQGGASAAGANQRDVLGHETPQFSEVRPLSSAGIFTRVQPVGFDEAVPAPVEIAVPEFVPPPSNSGDAVDARPRTIAEAMTPPLIPNDDAATRDMIDLDLTGALAMAAGESPRIAFAAARYREAYARLQAAQVLWLPSLRAGVSYNHHDGTLQASDGTVLNASRSSLHTGLGTRAVGAGTPAIHGAAAEFHATDAVFQPKIAGHGANARDFALAATRNDTLLNTALAYIELLRAMQQLKIAEQTLSESQRLADLTDKFARAGQGPQADADRTETEVVRLRNEVSRAQESVRVANVRLSEFLSLDPSMEVMPQETTIVPIDLVSHQMTTNELVATGLSNRPELAEASHLVCEAVYRYRREKYAPWLPSVLLGLSQSDFGGGFGSSINNYNSRFDFDATVYWELRNFGFGEKAKRDETRSRYDQARAIKVSMLDQVAREVAEAHAKVQSRQGRIAVAESGIESATQSYDRNVARIREGQGLPIEVLQSLQALDAARRDYLRTIADYNEAQFRLQRALGWPIR